MLMHFPWPLILQIQEGLSPNHLKKAKLMFFYTRYPSSNMLKMFFSDVKVSIFLTTHHELYTFDGSWTDGQLYLLSSHPK